MEKFSVLISVYIADRADWLKESIDSVLRQTAKPDEVIIVCDGPVKPELEVLFTEYGDRIKVYRFKENRGLGSSLNDGLEKCRNDLVARMDSDDISDPKRFEKLLSVFASGDFDLVGSFIDEFSGSTKNIISTREVPLTQEEILRFAKKRNPFNHPSVMFRKSSVISAGGYEDFPLFEDYWLWVRMLQKGAYCANIPEVLLHMRSGDELYRRRGGASYAGKLWRFRKALYRSGFTSFGEFLSSALLHAAVSLMPNALREAIYKNLLRK